MRVRIALVAAAGALLLGASSCSGGDDSPGTLPPTTQPTSTPQTTRPTPSPTPSEPTLPVLATQDSAAGAESFARFYLIAQDYANRTGQTTLLRSLGKCKGCDAVAAGIEKFYNEGGRVDGGGISILSSVAVKHVPRVSALVTVTYSQAEGRQVRADGGATVIRATSRNAILLTLRRQQSKWEVSNVQTTE